MLRVSEIYLSVQGEGPNVGTPTVFIRFAGCNLRCPNWPCDTPHAIDPDKYRKEWQRLTPAEIFQKVLNVAGKNTVNICYTGGEPFLQPHAELLQLTYFLRNSTKIRDIECFSNGTIVYPNQFTDLHSPSYIGFIMDWKLPGSGEITGHNNRFVNLGSIVAVNSNAIKFTIADRKDFDVAAHIWYDYIRDMGITVYAGVVWGKLENKTLIEWLLAEGLPWKLNVQIHNYIWPREQRGI